MKPVDAKQPFDSKFSEGLIITKNKLFKNDCQILTNGQLHKEKRIVVHALRYDLLF